MEELYTWLETQGSGLTMHSDFRKRARALGAEDRKQAALLYLLAALSRRFASFFDDVPMPARTAQEARTRLLALLKQGIDMADSPADLRLAFLNEVALSNLLAAPEPR